MVGEVPFLELNGPGLKTQLFYLLVIAELVTESEEELTEQSWGKTSIMKGL